MPHILSFLNESHETIFEVLMTDTEVAPLLGPFRTAFENNAMEQLEGMIGTLRVFTSRLATKESYWIFSKEGDDFDLKVSDPEQKRYDFCQGTITTHRSYHHYRTPSSRHTTKGITMMLLVLLSSCKIENDE